MKIRSQSTAGFDWDAGNRDKCAKHGVSARALEEVFESDPTIERDSFVNEERLRAFGRTSAGRHVFLVFTLRVRDGAVLIRPISARYMHQREVRWYEKEKAADAEER